MRFFPVFAAIVMLACPATAGTVEDIHGRGVVTCAVPASSPGISETVGAKRQGLAVDLCVIIAAAVLGRVEATAFLDVTAEDSAVALQAGEADVLLNPQAWRLAGEVEDGVMQVQPLLTRASDGAVFGPVVRQGDDGWFITLRWLLFALQTQDVPQSVVDQAASGLGLHPQWQDNIRSISKDYAALLERHMKILEAHGWASVPAGPAPSW